MARGERHQATTSYMGGCRERGGKSKVRKQVPWHSLFILGRMEGQRHRRSRLGGQEKRGLQKEREGGLLNNRAKGFAPRQGDKGEFSSASEVLGGGYH